MRGLTTLVTKDFLLSALEISCAVSVVAFALDSPEREKREGSRAPCGVKVVEVQVPVLCPVGCVEKTECPLQRTKKLAWTPRGRNQKANRQTENSKQPIQEEKAYQAKRVVAASFWYGAIR